MVTLHLLDLPDVTDVTHSHTTPQSNFNSRTCTATCFHGDVCALSQHGCSEDDDIKKADHNMICNCE